MTGWETGDMVFVLYFNKKEKPHKWVSMKDEPPSLFFTRIVRDMERRGANILPYLVEDLTRYCKSKEEAMKGETPSVDRRES